MSDEEKPDEPTQAQLRFLAWRRLILKDAGYRGAMLELLVESPVRLHDVTDLVAKGCPLEVAAHILL